MSTTPDRPEAETPPTTPRAELEQSGVPMFQAPSGFTPGSSEPCYSPHQFLALTQVGTDPEDDPALWLTEEKLDVVHREGILLLKQYFYHEKLDRYVTGKTKPHKRPNLFVRYNRALLARHVLNEVIVYLQEPDGRYREICRATPRQETLAEVDPNLALSYQKKYKEVLARKRTKTQEAYLNQESGAEAVARLRERSSARAERQKRSKPEPVVAEPIEHARDPIDPVLQKAVDEATDQGHETDHERAGGSKPLPRAQKDAQSGNTPGEPGSTVESLLGAKTGFEDDNDDD